MDIYEAIVKREPNNSSAINNLGVCYEHAGALYKALDCYERVVTLAPNDKIHQNNLTRIKNLIYEKTEEEVCAISDAISVESLENIGYTDEFQRKLFLIHDNEMRDILQRDLRECAIAVVAGQDKTATIMCGSIIEALLMLKIKEQGISKYVPSGCRYTAHLNVLPLPCLCAGCTNRNFDRNEKRSRSPAGPRRLGTATRISASLSRRLSAFSENAPGQVPKAAKYAVLIPGHAGFPKRVERSEGSDTTPTSHVQKVLRTE